VPDIKSIDFEIIKEPWQKYQISDGSVLRVRTILKKVERVMEGDKIHFNVDGQTLTVIHADPALKGTKNDRPIGKNEIQKSIDKDDMRYDTLAQEFNEYILDDGTKIKIYTNITNISRTKLFDRTGDPVYVVSNSTTMDIKPSSQYKLPPPSK